MNNIIISFKKNESLSLADVRDRLMETSKNSGAVVLNFETGYKNLRHIYYAYAMCFGYGINPTLSITSQSLIHNTSVPRAIIAKKIISSINKNILTESTKDEFVSILNNYFEMQKTNLRSKTDAYQMIDKLINDVKTTEEGLTKYLLPNAANSFDDMCIILQAISNIAAKKRANPPLSNIVIPDNLKEQISNNSAYNTIYKAIISAAANGHALQANPINNSTNLLAFDAIKGLVNIITNNYNQTLGLSSEFVSKSSNNITNLIHSELAEKLENNIADSSNKSITKKLTHRQ